MLPCGRARASWSRRFPGRVMIYRTNDYKIRTADSRTTKHVRAGRGRGHPRKPPCSAGRACSRTPGRRRARDRATRTTNSHNASAIRMAIRMRVQADRSAAIRSPDADPKCNEIKILLPHAEQRSIRLGNKIQVPTVPKRNLQPLGKMQQRFSRRARHPHRPLVRSRRHDDRRSARYRPPTTRTRMRAHDNKGMCADGVVG